MAHEFQWENRPTCLDFPLFLGIPQWKEPAKRVPFTAEPEIPEILTKWKAPQDAITSMPSHLHHFFKENIWMIKLPLRL